MKTIYQIARSEFRGLFGSPIAWFVLVIFTIQLSMGFSDMVVGNIKNAFMGQQLRSLTFNIYVNGFGSPLFKIFYTYLTYIIPLLTMGLMSHEYSSGSIRLLFSSPITNAQIILGKFLSMMMYGMVLMLLVFVYVIFGLFAVESLDFPLLLSGMLHMYLVICLYAAIGLFVSSLTSYQVVAAIGSIAMLMVVGQIGSLFQGIDFLRDIFHWFSPGAHGMLTGLITSGDVLYYILAPAMFVVFSILVLHFKRNRRSWAYKILTYVAVFIVTSLLGYVTSRPGKMLYWDVSRYDQNTLTEKSREVLSQFPGELKITSYVNILDGHQAMTSMPRSRIGDRSFLHGYLRYKPDIKMEYVYFYDYLLDEHNHYRDLSPKELAEEARMEAKTAGLKFKNVLSPEAIREVIDLSGEGNAFVRQMEYENGKKVWLRMFHDFARYPGEQEITDALQVLQTRQMNIGFLTGHGERDLYGEGNREYSGFFNEKGSRGAQVNHGCHLFPVSFAEGGIPEELDMLLIADVRTPMSEAELDRIHELADGGLNMTVNVDVGSGETMRDLLAIFGVEMVPGVLIEEHPDYAPTLIRAEMTPEAERISKAVGRRAGRHPVTLSGAVGLTYNTNTAFEVYPFLISSSRVWNELEQDDFEENTPVFNPAAGERQDSFVLGLILTREVKGKEQRVLICGDADWMSNVEISTWRGFATANATLTSEMLWWGTYNQYPLDLSRPAQPDNAMKIPFEARNAVKWGFCFFLPLLWVIAGVVVWLRRRRK